MIEQNNIDLLASGRNNGRPYGPDTQVLVIGVHGTNNGPGNVREVTERMGSTLSNNPNVGKTVIDTSFDWQDRSGTMNSTADRAAAAKSLTTHTLSELDGAYRNGTLDRNKPLVIVYAGFSHGGNVAMLASNEVAAGLKDRGITNGAINMATMSTPAYTRGEENPAFAARAVQSNGVGFSHTHFSVQGDGVIRGAVGNSHYPGPVIDVNGARTNGAGITTNVDMRGISYLNGIANHGAPQDSGPHMDRISEVMNSRFNGLAPPSQQRSDNGTGTQVASASTNSKGLDDTAHPYNKQYTQALQGLEGIPQSGNASKQDVAAALVKAGADSGFNKDGPLAVVAGKQEGSVFAVQGETTNPASLRAKVDIASVQPGSAQQSSEALTATQAVAQSNEQTQQATKARVA